MIAKLETGTPVFRNIQMVSKFRHGCVIGEAMLRMDGGHLSRLDC